MAEDLDQNAINNLFSAAAEAAAATAPTAVNFGKRGSISTEQMQMLVSVNQVFSQSLGITLSARLSSVITLTMVAAERTLYHNLLDNIDIEASYLGQSRFKAPDARSLIALDLTLVEPLVHLALGGINAIPKNPHDREVTLIDVAIMEIVMGVICTEMNLMWAPFGLQAAYDGRVLPIHARRFYPQSEYVMSFTYEVHIGDRVGSLQIALATVIASSLLREVDRRDHQRVQPPATRHLLHERLANLGVRSTLRLAPFKIMASDVVNLRTGMLLESNIPTSTPCLLGMPHGPAWEALPMLSDERIAAKLIRPHIPSLPPH